MNIVLIGKPGSGKGTQAKRLAKELNMIHLSTGDLLREMMPEAMGSGNLVDDETVISLVKKKIEQNEGKKFIFDGFPRTVHQAEELDRMIKVDVVIKLDVSDDEAVRRILSRGNTSGRADDNEPIAKKRLDVYKEETMLVLKHYAQTPHRMITVNGHLDKELIYKIIKSLF